MAGSGAHEHGTWWVRDWTAVPMDMVGQENGQTQETGMTSVHSQPGHRAWVLLSEHCQGSCEVTGSLAFSSPTDLKA